MIHSIGQQTGAPVRRICRVLNLPRSSFYQAAKLCQSELENRRIGGVIEKIFRRHRARYGYRRVHEDLKELEIECGSARVRQIMKTRGLRAITSKRFRPRTSDGRADRPCDNLLVERAAPSGVDQVWLGDITFIRISGRWYYLAVVIDLCSRRVVGWHLADHLRSTLVCRALRKALHSRRPSRGIIFHSDRGSQYGSGSFRALLKDHGIVQSMSRKANPYDNAWTESFIGTLKSEMIEAASLVDPEQAQMALFSYIDGYYNNQRKHSSLAYLSPAEFESNITKN